MHPKIRILRTGKSELYEHENPNRNHPKIRICYSGIEELESRNWKSAGVAHGRREATSGRIHPTYRGCANRALPSCLWRGRDCGHQVCGKTWAALEHGASASYVDENLDLARADPAMMLLGDRPHIIDEWQRVPQIWDYVRHEVDRTRGTRGAYILTGSATPAFGSKAEAPAHSGAGRIGRVRMHPMTLAETGESNGKVSLAGLFEHRFEPAGAMAIRRGLSKPLAAAAGPRRSIWFRLTPSSSPANISTPRFRAASRRSVSTPILLVESPHRSRAIWDRQPRIKRFLWICSVPRRNPQRLPMRPRCAVLGCPQRHVHSRGGSRLGSRRARKRRFTVKPKRYLADPSLACALLGMSSQALLADWQTFGLVFENLVIRDLSVYARSLDLLDSTPVRYYRDDSGLECDAIVQLADGRWAAFEIKVSEDKANAGVESLKRVRKKVCGNPRSCTREPEFMAVSCGGG